MSLSRISTGNLSIKIRMWALLFESLREDLKTAPKCVLFNLEERSHRLTNVCGLVINKMKRKIDSKGPLPRNSTMGASFSPFSLFRGII